jgi:hypothetical protein
MQIDPTKVHSLQIYNPDTRFIWKQAQPWNSEYPRTSGLNYPILFDELPQKPEVDEFYVPTYRYIPNLRLPIPPLVTQSINYINNILFNHFSTCMEYSGVCKLWTDSTRSHSTRSCCGFTAPIFAVLIHEYYLKQALFEKKDKTPEEDAMVKQLKIQAEQKAIIFYQNIVGYGKTDAEFSWNTRCQGWLYTLDYGVNLLTFYSSPTKKEDGNYTCATHHHFVVFINPKHPDVAIIIDAWAGIHGRRGKWVRAMLTSHLTDVLTKINQLTGSKEHIQLMNMLLNEYFIVPNNYDPVDNLYKSPDLSDTNEKLFVGNINLTRENARIESMYALRLPTYVLASASASASARGKRRSKRHGKRRGKKNRVLTRRR